MSRLVRIAGMWADWFTRTRKGDSHESQSDDVVWYGMNQLGDDVIIHTATRDGQDGYSCSRELDMPGEPEFFTTAADWQRHVRQAHYRPGERQPVF